MIERVRRAFRRRKVHRLRIGDEVELHGKRAHIQQVSITYDSHGVRIEFEAGDDDWRAR